MSVSIYYTASRDAPLTATEASAIRQLVAKYSVDDQIERRSLFRKTPNWESFCIYDPASPCAPGVIFEGATKLPDNTQEFMWQGLQHWCHLLSEIRVVLLGADWHVTVEDHEIAWNEETREYDPSR